MDKYALCNIAIAIKIMAVVLLDIRPLLLVLRKDMGLLNYPHSLAPDSEYQNINIIYANNPPLERTILIPSNDFNVYKF